MKIEFSKNGWEQYAYWQENDRTVLRKVNKLIKDTQRNPYEGIGKPEALKHKYTGYWSRRITEEHRLIYNIENDKIQITSCRFHYDD